MTPARAYQRLVNGLVAEAEVEVGRMLRAGGLRYRRRFFAMLHGDDLVVKLPADRVTELVDAGAGARFDRGDGRIMREWIALRAAGQDRWPALAAEALRFAQRNAGHEREVRP